jgi:hypothetical protein
MPTRSYRGPVTLVVERVEDHALRAVSWTFPSELAAMSVAGAFRDEQRWLLVKGVYYCAADAVAASSDHTLLLRECGSSARPPASGLMRKCDAPPAVHSNRRSA